ncbi:MAG: cobalamin-dependent protein [Nodosilinea sp. LVE1205-7]
MKGDVHDIGKNLVDIILSNNGYRVINLGIKQPVETIIQAYREHQADCIAMSGLLVKSTAFMKDNLETFNAEGITVPVILGGRPSPPSSSTKIVSAPIRARWSTVRTPFLICTLWIS